MCMKQTNLQCIKNLIPFVPYVTVRVVLHRCTNMYSIRVCTYSVCMYGYIPMNICKSRKSKCLDNKTYIINEKEELQTFIVCKFCKEIWVDTNLKN